MNVKQGELAWITGAETPGLNGRFVTVVRRAVPGEVLQLSDGDVVRISMGRTRAWIVEAKTPMPYYPLSGGMNLTTIRPVNDCNLRPVRGISVQQKEFENVE